MRVMLKNPEVGDLLFADEEQVTDVNVTVPQLTTGLGPFTGCIQTIDLDDGDINYYAPDIGMVKKVDSSGSSGWELKYLFEPKPNAVVIPLF